MKKNSHSSEDEFIAFLCGELAEANGKKLSHHLLHCQSCSSEMNAYKNIFTGVQHMFQTQGKQISAAHMHKIMQEEVRNQKICYGRFRFVDFFPMAAAKSSSGIVKIILGNVDLFELDEKLRKLFPGKIPIHSEHGFSDLQDQMKAYICGDQKAFTLPLDKTLIKGAFQSKVLSELMHVEYGSTISYGDLAKRIQQPKASRAVGNALGRNPLPILIPCHRVLAGDGQIGGFTGGIEIKEKLLKIENIMDPTESHQLSLF